MLICQKITQPQPCSARPALVGLDVLTAIYECLKKNTHTHTQRTTTDTPPRLRHYWGCFHISPHEILIYPRRAGIFSPLSNINAEFEWLTQEEALILSPWRPSNGPRSGGRAS